MSPMSPRLLRPRQSLHPEAADWAARVTAAGATYSGSTLTAVSKFCRSIDAAGIRSKFLRLNLFCGNSITAALIPLYRSSAYGGAVVGGATDTNNNFVSADYVETGASGGLNGNGSTKYLNTGVAANATSYGDRHLSVYAISRSPNSYDISIGARNASPASYFEQTTDGSSTSYSFRSSDAVTSATDSSFSATGAMMMGVHPSNNVAVLYKNGASAGTGTMASLSNSYSGAVFVFAGNSGGTATDHADITAGGYSIGFSMTAAQALSYYNAMQALQTALKRQV